MQLTTGLAAGELKFRFASADVGLCAAVFGSMKGRKRNRFWELEGELLRISLIIRERRETSVEGTPKQKKRGHNNATTLVTCNKITLLNVKATNLQ